MAVDDAYKPIGDVTFWQEDMPIDIYDWNEASRRCFESMGFVSCKKLENGSSFRLTF